MESRPKVLFVNPAPNVFGAEASMLRLIGAGGMDAAVAAPTGGSLERELATRGLTFFPLEVATRPAWKNPLPHLRFFFRLVGILRHFRPDALVVNLDGHTPLVVAAAQLLRMPVIRFCRFEFTPPARALERWAWRHCNAVVCPSETVKAQFVAWAPQPLADATAALYDSCDIGARDEAGASAFRREFALEDAELAGYFGRLDPAKDIPCAIRATARLAAKRPALRLVIAGGSADAKSAAERRKLERLADELGVADRIVFTGYLAREKVPGAMAALSILVLPSRSESFGTVLAEAWNLGIPTIAADAGACRETTLASGGGLLHPPGDDEALADAMEQLLADRLLRERLGRAGMEWTQANCDAKSRSERFRAVLARAIEGRNP